MRAASISIVGLLRVRFVIVEFLIIDSYVYRLSRGYPLLRSPDSTLFVAFANWHP